MWLLPLLATVPSAAWAQDALTFSPLSADPEKAIERRNVLNQTLAEQQATIEQLRRDIARIETKQTDQLQTLQVQHVSADMIEQARRKVTSPKD